MTESVPFAVRSSSGLVLKLGPPAFSPLPKYGEVQSKQCRIMLFSPEGEYFAYAEGVNVKIVSTETWEVVGVIEGNKACHLAFSPRGTYLVIWETFYVTKDNPQGKPNLNIYKSENGSLVKSFIQRKLGNWEPQWSADEKLFSRINNTDVVFYEESNFEKIVCRINCHKVAAYKLSPSVDSYFVLCHVPGDTKQPAGGRLYKFPNFNMEQAVSSKSFFQADKVDFYWNSKGNNALLLTSTEVDKTGGSYYGKQGLHFMGIVGPAVLVSLDKEGPIYSVAWSPKNHEFCVMYGFMPPKATIFNTKCEPVIQLGTRAWNSIFYNPQGNLLLLGGFGNLRGHVEVLDVSSRKTVGTCEATDSTLLRWSPDGTHFLTATTAPRLRIGNGYKIWHYSGALLHEKLVESPEELYDVCWKNYRKYAFKDPVISGEKIEGIASSQPVASKQVYRPPSARNRPTVNFKLDDEEEEGHKPGADNVSKASLKQKKKRDAKKAKKLEETGEPETKSSFQSSVQINLTGDPEVDKKLKNLKKKLDAIDKLKEQQAQGKTLEINQLAKLKTEAEVLKELQELQI